MDPLSNVLSLLKPRSYVSAGFDAFGDWSIHLADPQKRIKCYAVVSGACRLSVEGVAQPVRIAAGDCFVLPGGRPFRLASDPALAPVNADLASSGDPVAMIAWSLGYESESAFSAAFRRIMGRSPRRFAPDASDPLQSPVNDDAPIGINRARVKNPRHSKV
jgi:hypothetical protein